MYWLPTTFYSFPLTSPPVRQSVSSHFNWSLPKTVHTGSEAPQGPLYNWYRSYCRGVNLLMPNDPYMGRTAPLTSKRCILYIYSTNIGTEYFKHPLYSPFFSLQNAVCFIMLTCLVPVLFTFYIQGVLRLKK